MSLANQLSVKLVLMVQMVKKKIRQSLKSVPKFKLSYIGSFFERVVCVMNLEV